MKQGVLVPHRVRLLLSDGHSCYRPRRTGERKRKSVRGCIVGPDIAVLSLVVVKQGESDIPGLTDTVLPKRLGPKRASKIRKFFNLGKEDDVRQYVVKREVQSKKNPEKKPTLKAYVLFFAQTLCRSDLHFFAAPKSSASSPPSASNAAATSALSSVAGSTDRRSRRQNTSKYHVLISISTPTTFISTIFYFILAHY
jgi:hypothetical protein